MSRRAGWTGVAGTNQGAYIDTQPTDDACRTPIGPTFGLLSHGRHAVAKTTRWPWENNAASSISILPKGQQALVKIDGIDVQRPARLARLGQVVEAGYGVIEQTMQQPSVRGRKQQLHAVHSGALGHRRR